MEDIRKNFVAMPTLIRGTAEEEKEKALRSLENRVFKQREDFEYLKDRYRGIYNAVSMQDLNLKIQKAEINALKSRVYLALAVLSILCESYSRFRSYRS